MTLYIRERPSGSHQVVYRTGGRGSAFRSGGTFKTREAAEERARHLEMVFAAGGTAPAPKRRSADRLSAGEIAAWQGRAVVYFVQGAGRTKIGITATITTRVESLRRSSPVPLDVVHILPGGRDLELALHEEFAKYREHGEWFSLPARWRAKVLAVQARFESRMAPVWPREPHDADASHNVPANHGVKP